MNLSLFLKTTAFSLALCFTHFASAEVVVIVHPSNNASFDENTIRLIFLGRQNSFSNNEKAIPVELAKGETRQLFLKKYVKRTEIDLQHYWSIKTFTGKGQPPKKYATEKEIIDVVANNPSMIGFIDASRVNDSIKVAEVATSKKRLNWGE